MRVLCCHPSGLMYTAIYLRLEPLGLELGAAAARAAGHRVKVYHPKLQLANHGRPVSHEMRLAPAPTGARINRRALYVLPPDPANPIPPAGRQEARAGASGDVSAASRRLANPIPGGRQRVRPTREAP